MAQPNPKQPPAAAADQGKPKGGVHRIVQPPATIEDRLVAKAEVADWTDYSDRRSLDQMSREELDEFLYDR